MHFSRVKQYICDNTREKQFIVWCPPVAQRTGHVELVSVLRGLILLARFARLCWPVMLSSSPVLLSVHTSHKRGLASTIGCAADNYRPHLERFPARGVYFVCTSDLVLSSCFVVAGSPRSPRIFCDAPTASSTLKFTIFTCGLGLP